MDIRQIRSFLAVAEHLNFRRAAEQLGLSQPALSLQVQALEQEIGVQLLHRDRQTTSLTYAGGIFQDRGSELLRRSERAAEKARRAAKGSIDFLRIGFISTATTAGLLPPLIARFRASHPSIELTLQNIPNAEQLALIESGGLDLGFVRLPATPPPTVDLAAVHRERHALLMPDGHPLAGKKNLCADDLQRHPFIMYSRKNAPAYHDFIMRSLNNFGVNPQIAQEVGEMYTLVALVSAGLGLAVAPVSTRNYNLPGILVRRLSWLPSAEIAIGCRKGDLQPACRLFVEMALKPRDAASPAVVRGR
jgi:DNA-binding transcriptional LysR family regulator